MDCCKITTTKKYWSVFIALGIVAAIFFGAKWKLTKERAKIDEFRKEMDNNAVNSGFKGPITPPKTEGPTTGTPME